MKNFTLLLVMIIIYAGAWSQDLSFGLIINDLSSHNMEPLNKPDYLESYTDPAFGTTIRRITNAQPGEIIKPMYSTIQAWNADESLMIVYNQSLSEHQLLNGLTYEYIRDLDDFHPDDIEQIFWDFQSPDILYFPDASSDNFVRYNVQTQSQEVVVNMAEVSGCTEYISMGNDVQMMSWDSDVFSFRCGNSSAYYYRISTGEFTIFDFSGDVNYVAPMPGASGNTFYHNTDSYDANGELLHALNESSSEHSCMGKLANGHDGHWAVAFADGPLGGCDGNIVAHDIETGECTSIISEDQGYEYSQSGTHISAVAYKNIDGGWIAASMMGFDQDGQSLLDQELVIAKVEDGEVKVCRIGHHRSDEDQFDYWGEPHATISPLGTRVLFGSDWSGAEDGQSVDCYVVELPSYEVSTGVFTLDANTIADMNNISILKPKGQKGRMEIFDTMGKKIADWDLSNIATSKFLTLPQGMYIYRQFDNGKLLRTGKFMQSK